MTKSKPLDGGRPRLSTTILVRDAAEELADCIESVRSIADEIVVADLGSTDGTLEIARQAAHKVCQIEWQNDLAAARNECLAHATGDWVLWLEADETLDETAAQQLRNFIDESADAHKAYLLYVQRPAATAASGCEQIGQLRLHPNREGLRFSGRVREQILTAVLNAGLGIDALDCSLQRRAYGAGSERERAQSRQKLNLANLIIAEDGEQPEALLARAEALAELGRAKEAGAVYSQAIQLSASGTSNMLEAYYGLLTSMDADPDSAELQRSTCLKALAIYPLDAQLLCGMGSYLLRAQRLDLAARSYETAATHGRIDPSIWHLADLSDVAVTCWSLVLQLLGDGARAEKTLQEALTARPDSIRVRRQLIDLLVKAGRDREALAECNMLPSHAAYRAVLPQVIQGATLTAKGKAAEALGPLQAAYQAGCRDPLCLRWLAGAHLALGNWTEVEQIADQWAQQEPGNLEVVAFRQALAKRAGRSRGQSAASESRRVDQRSSHGLPIDLPSTMPRSTSPSRW